MMTVSGKKRERAWRTGRDDETPSLTSPWLHNALQHVGLLHYEALPLVPYESFEQRLRVDNGKPPRAPLLMRACAAVEKGQPAAWSDVAALWQGPTLALCKHFNQTG